MLLTIIFILALLLFFSLFRTAKEDYHSHWAKLLGDFKFSTKEFYSRLKTEMESHQIENLSFSEVSLKTGSIFSSERIYLRVKWKDYRYDLCFAPFGDGCFVSWWLFYETSPSEMFISKIPFIGGILANALFKKTYYKIDTASSFMTYAHHSVIKVIEEITKETGIRISDEERKPILKDIFSR